MWTNGLEFGAKLLVQPDFLGSGCITQRRAFLFILYMYTTVLCPRVLDLLCVPRNARHKLATSARMYVRRACTRRDCQEVPRSFTTNLADLARCRSLKRTAVVEEDRALCGVEGEGGSARTFIPTTMTDRTTLNLPLSYSIQHVVGDSKGDLRKKAKAI